MAHQNLTQRLVPRRTKKGGLIPADRILVQQVPLSPLILSRNDRSNRVYLEVQDEADSRSAADILRSANLAVLRSFKSGAQSHPDRLIYGVAGLLFDAGTPLPFGGSKHKPGYASFEGSNCLQLLDFMITSAFRSYWSYRGRKAVDLVVMAINRVLDLVSYGEKDFLDECVMKGMKKSGHIEWFGAAFMPDWLAHISDVPDSRGVFFTPNRLRLISVNRQQQWIAE